MTKEPQTTKRNYYFFQPMSGRKGLMLIAKHPSNCGTWHWGVSLERFVQGENRKFIYSKGIKGFGQWHNRLNLFGFGYLCFSFQDYHYGR